MYPSLRKDHQRRQRYRGEQRVSGNALNVLSLTNVLRIHHFHLDRALITQLCSLLNNDLQSQITRPTSLCVTTAFVHPFHLSDRLCIGHRVRDVCKDISDLGLPTAFCAPMDEIAWTRRKAVFVIKNKALLCCFEYDGAGAISTVHTWTSGREHKGANLQEWKNDTDCETVIDVNMNLLCSLFEFLWKQGLSSALARWCAEGRANAVFPSDDATVSCVVVGYLK